MYDDQDWEAVNDSEIFREYVKNELKKEAAKKEDSIDQFEKALDEELLTYAELEQFQKQVDSKPKLREYFIKCKLALEKNPELRNKVDKKFIQGIFLLDLSEI